MYIHNMITLGIDLMFCHQNISHIATSTIIIEITRRDLESVAITTSVCAIGRAPSEVVATATLGYGHC